MYTFTLEEFPQMADEDEGRVAPFIFGPYRDHSPICIRVGTSDVLATTILIDGTPTAIELSSPEKFERYANSGKVQVNGERFSYSSKHAGTLQLRGIIRAIDSTQKAEHQYGSQVYEIILTVKYVVAENPRLVHFHKGVDVVYLSGRRKAATQPPHHVINLDDRTVVAGRSFVTITMDLSTLKPEDITPPPPTPPPSREPPGNVSVPPPAIPGPRATGYAGGGSGLAGYLRPVRPTGGGGGISISSPPPRAAPKIVYRYPPPVIGEVSCDVTGLQDDTLGTITGVALALIEHPARVSRTLLREAWGELDDANYRLDTFAATHALQLTDGIRWSLAYEGEPLPTMKDAILMHGKAHLFNFGGKWYYLYRRRGASVFTFRPDMGFGEAPTFDFTPRTDITTELLTHYERGIRQRRIFLRSEMWRRYGAQRTRQLSLPWIYDRAVARLLAAYWLSQWDRQRVRVQIPAPWEGIHLEPWDVFSVDSPVLDAWGKLMVTFHLIDFGRDTDTGALAIFGEEGDPPGLAMSGRVRVQATKTMAMSGKVSVGAPPLRPVGLYLVGGLMAGHGSMVLH